MSTAPFLSIVVPFHNSAATCLPLLKELAQLDDSDPVELIFVDDGSTDATRGMLRDFARQSRAAVQLIERSRGGPGAARNSGLAQATGRFVWFVDSDDTIDLGAISLAKKAQWPELDIIVWDWDHPTIVQRLAPGLHSTRNGPAPAEVLDPIVCNWFSLAFLKRTRLRFPEFCFYEATPLEFFILPLLVNRYLKVDYIAYRANTRTPSITRGSGRFEPHHFDCLHTIPLGMAFVDQARLDEPARAEFEAAFIRTYLWYVIRVSRLPETSWIRAARVMRQYRDEAKRLGVRLDPVSLYPGRRPSELLVRFLWSLSAWLPSQQSYFQRLRERAWSNNIVWEPPILPAHYHSSAVVTPHPRPEADEGSNPPAQAHS